MVEQEGQRLVDGWLFNQVISSRTNTIWSGTLLAILIKADKTAWLSGDILPRSSPRAFADTRLHHLPRRQQVA
jgi:hypothetical protein